MDVLQAAAGGSRAPLRRRHPRDAALPAAADPDRRAAGARADDDRRARLPSTCPTPRPPATAASTSRARSRPRRSTPSAECSATSTARGCSSARRRGLRGLFGLGRAPAVRSLPPYTELVRFDAGPRARRRRAARPPRVSCSPTISRGARRATRSRPSPSSSATCCPRCWPATWQRTTPTRSPPSGWPARRSSSPRAQRVAARRRGRAGDARPGRDRRRLQGAVVPPRPPQAVRSAPAARPAGQRLGARDDRTRRGGAVSVAGPTRRAGARRIAAIEARPAGRRLGGGRGPRRAPAGTGALTALTWVPAAVPGTAAGALHAAGQWTIRDERDFDAEEWWFRTALRGGARAPASGSCSASTAWPRWPRSTSTASCVLTSDSMFGAHELDVTDVVRAENELASAAWRWRRCSPRRRRPRARWRTRLVAERNLRFFRTMLLGRTPGFAAGPAVVGPYRPVWLERRRGLGSSGRRCAPRCDGATAARVAARCPARLRACPSGRRRRRWSCARPDGALHRGRPRASIPTAGCSRRARGRRPAALVAPHARRPRRCTRSRCACSRAPASSVIELGRVGFRTAGEPGADVARAGIALRVNGVAVFARGAVWTPRPPRARHADRASCAPRWRRSAHAGMNMVRIPGIACYETRRIPRSLRRARDPRLAGLHVRQPRLSRSRSRTSWPR